MKRLLFIFLQILFTYANAYADADISRIAELRERADSLHSVGRTDSAAVVGREAIRLAKESGDPTQIVGTNAAQGVFLRSMGNIDGALECYDAALAVVTSGKFRENPDQEAIEEIASLYINLAVLHLDTQHKEEGARNALLSAEWIAKSDDTELRSTIYGVAGSVLTGCGELKEAKRLQALAYKDAVDSGDKEAAFRAAAYTMLIADRLGNKKEAQAWRERCNELIPGIESVMAKLVYYQAECSIALKNNDTLAALRWFNQIMGMEGVDNLPFVKFDCYNNMHAAYAGIGDFENAYETLLKSNEFRDSLWQEEKSESLRDLTVKYQTKETELALARSESRRSRTLMWLFIALGILLLGIICFVVYAGRARRRRMERELEFVRLREETGRRLTQEYVEGLESERARMSRELHDGVCNDLLAIQMNINNSRPIATTMELIDSCRESVRRISHELLPPEFAYADLDEVVRYFVSKQADANSGKVSVSYVSSAEGNVWSRVPDTVALDVYRIIQEAVGNAVRHSGATEVEVTLALSGDTMTAEVRDNGVFKDRGRGGIGLESMRKRAKAINGDIRIDASEEEGTMVSLSVKF